MNVFSHPEFDNHEHLSFFCDPETGLKAIVAIHNTSRGPALGGCRMFPYATDEEALRDVLPLSRGMTYKSAPANLDLGGAKSVIIGDPRKAKTEALMAATDCNPLWPSPPPPAAQPWADDACSPPPPTKKPCPTCCGCPGGCPTNPLWPTWTWAAASR